MDKTDRISSLPNCLLFHILSFVKTKESVQTTVLSKRWIHVWKSVPCLNLYASDFTKARKFENFVNAVLLFHKSEHLDTFRLTWHTPSEEKCDIINIWISRIVTLKHRVLNINVSQLDRAGFIQWLLTCSTLESLFLWPQKNGTCWFYNARINLPCLKVLNLGFVGFDNSFIERLMLGCPILEELAIEDCIFYDVTKKICFRNMKKLKIKNVDMSDDETRFRVEIPSLVDLYCEMHLRQVSFENMSSLERANITLIHGVKNNYEFKLLSRLSNVKHLTLSGSPVKKMLDEESAYLPDFFNLKSLDLGSFRVNNDFEPIPSFLSHTPSLEKITLRHIKLAANIPRRANKVQCESLKYVDIVFAKSNHCTLISNGGVLGALASNVETANPIIVNFIEAHI